MSEPPRNRFSITCKKSGATRRAVRFSMWDRETEQRIRTNPAEFRQFLDAADAAWDSYEQYLLGKQKDRNEE